MLRVRLPSPPSRWPSCAALSLKLSDEAFLNASAVLLGTPVSHAPYLRAHTPFCAQTDVFGDRLLDDSGHAAPRLTHAISPTTKSPAYWQTLRYHT